MSNFQKQFKPYIIENYGYIRLPKIDISKEQKELVGLTESATNCEFLLQLTREGFKKKQNKIKRERWKEYGDRVKTEIALLDELGFVDYILLVWMVEEKAKQLGAFWDYGRGCLNSDTSIFTDRGPVKIDKVLIGDKVLTTSNTYEEVIDVFEYNCTEKLIKINTWMKTANSPSMTLDHKVLAIKNPFKNLKSIYKKRPTVIGISDLERNEIFQLKNAEWVQAKDIKPWDYLVESERDIFPAKNLDKIDLWKFSKNKDILSDNSILEYKTANANGKERSVKIDRYLEIDESFLYVLGFFLGDGWYSRLNPEIGFAFHSEDNKLELEKIKSYFDSKGFEYSFRSGYKGKHLIQLIVRSNILKKMFSELVPDYCEHKEIPKQFLFLDNIKTQSLVNGLLDSDGSHCENGRISFDSISEKLILQVKLLVKRLGYRVSSTKRNYKNKINWKTSYKLRLYKNRINKNTFNTITNDGFIFKKVISTEIVDNPSSKVYDIHVKDNHNYHTEDYIVHNSCAGSLINYLTGISGVDPIEKKLFFERFISKTRSAKKEINGQTYLKGDMIPDVDCNSSLWTPQIVQWLKEIYPNRVSRIVNFSTLTTKILLKDVSKIYSEYSEDQAKEVSDMVTSKFGIVQEIEDAYKENEKFKKWADGNKDIVSISQKLSGLLRQTSIHASGYLVSYYPLTDVVPLELSKEGELVSGYDMRQVCNFATKLDLLGLTTNAVIKNIIDNIPEKVDDIELDSNPIIYDQYQNNNLLPYGLYQISAHCAYGVLNKVKPKNIEELSDVNALARPGSLAYVEDYVKGDKELLNPLFKSAIGDTKNICLYQEQLMQLAVLVGFTLDDAEIIRKIVGKKQLEKVKEWKEKIYKKVEEKGFKVEVADAYWKLVNDSASYSFNKCIFEEEIVYLSNNKQVILKEVRRGDKIKAYNYEKDIIEYVEVLDIMNNEVPLYEVELESGEKIKISMDHKLLCEDNKMYKLKEILSKNLKIISIKDEYLNKYDNF